VAKKRFWTDRFVARIKTKLTQAKAESAISVVLHARANGVLDYYWWTSLLKLPKCGARAEVAELLPKAAWGRDLEKSLAALYRSGSVSLKKRRLSGLIAH